MKIPKLWRCGDCGKRDTSPLTHTCRIKISKAGAAKVRKIQQKKEKQ